MRIGGAARIVIFPESPDDLIFCVSTLISLGVKYKVLGRMSNVLPPDKTYDGAIIRTDKINRIEISGNTICVQTGVTMPALANRAALCGLSGLEELSGIPGSVGGLISGNAGAFGKETADILVSAALYAPNDGRTFSINRKELAFGYRKSLLKTESYILLSAKLSLLSDDTENIQARIARYKALRREKQPSEPSLGSTFKRPSKGYASKMLDECGLRGFRVGGAAISEKHAGFIVNYGGATAVDVKAIVKIASDAVYDKFGILLEREIEYL